MKTEQLIPLCRRYHAMLLHSDEQTISIAVVNTPPAELMEALRFATQKRIDIECWSQEQMDKRLQAQEKQAQLAQNDGPENSAERVNQILEQALRQRASDIHIEPTETHLRIRLRVDGVLHALPLLAPELAAPVIARLKVLASLDIAEHRLPQDGQFALNLAGRPLSFRHRHSALPLWRKIVLRLRIRLTRRWIWKHSDSHPPSWRLSPALNQPQGLLLVTGPTGSGKTVTLSALQARNREQVNICSVEDPLEIPIAGMNQTQINPAPDSLFTVCCAPCYARIRILSWWARSAMPRPLKSRSKPPRPVIWCSPPCTPIPPVKP